MPTLIEDSILGPMQSVLTHFVNALPSLVWAIVLLGMGSVLAKLIRKGVQKVFNMGNVDSYCDKAGLSTMLEHLGLGKSPSKLMGTLIWWFVFMIFFVAAAN